jgi:flagellin-like protein
MQHERKRGIRSKRGISTVVASILVLAITVALAVGLLTFGSSFMGSQEKMSPPTTDQIKVENVAFDSPAAGQITVTVRNVGLGDVNIDALYIDGAFKTITSGSGKLTSGNAAQLEATFAATPGHAYTIKVATSNGGESTYTAVYS